MRKIFDDIEFFHMFNKYILEVLEYLLVNQIGFRILINKAFVRFEPQLPENLYPFEDFVIFELCNYTLKSAKIKDDILSFHASFGDEDFESIVSINIAAINQLSVDDVPLLINTTNYEKFIKISEQQNLYDDSKQRFMSNPENKPLLKK